MSRVKEGKSRTHLETELGGLYSSHVTTRTCEKPMGTLIGALYTRAERTSTYNNSIVLT